MFQYNRNLRFLQWLGVFIFFASAGFFLEKNATDIQTSVISNKQAAAYDGIVAPIQKVPNWVGLNNTQWKNDYNNIPADKLVPLPFYDPAQLKISSSQLGWTTEADKLIRNAKVTYSTPYMGNYKLDGHEYGGSHLALDIKIPMFTPVFVIGNGIVVKVASQSSGFGNHIVVKHENFPSFDDPNVKVTYYSSYNHLDSIAIGEGDIVTKGQQIGLSGQSGLASTPHLHFQIDNEKASFHPYWPFDYKDANAAGLDFSSAINAGLGKEKAIATTINPMLYVQKYANGNAQNLVSPPVVIPAPSPEVSLPSPQLNADPASISPEIPVVLNASPILHSAADPNQPNTSSIAENNIVPDLTPQPSPIQTDFNTPAPLLESPPVALKISSDNNSFVVGADKKIKILAIDQQGNLVLNYKPRDGVTLTVENGGATLKESYIAHNNFTNGVAETFVKPTSVQGLRIKANDGVLSGVSEIMQSSVFQDVASNTETYDAIQFLKNYKIIQGYSDGSFKPSAVVSRVEALKVILKGLNTKIQIGEKLPFKDTEAGGWYVNYVATAYKADIVKGYADLTFRPDQTVNRVEFLKMLFKAMNVQPQNRLQVDVFSDVAKESWYASYVAYAKDKNLISTQGNLFKPEEGMTREEVAQVIRRVILLKAADQEKFDSSLAVSDGQLSKYFGI